MRQELPPGWIEIELEDHVYIAGRIGWRGLKAEEYTTSGPILLSVPNLNHGNHVDFSKVNYISKLRFDESPEIELKKGDTLLVKDGAGIGKLGYVAHLPGKATVNSSLLVVRPNDELLSHKYLFYYLKGPKLQGIALQRITGSATPHLFQKDIKHFQILVPPTREQKRIVDKLDLVIAKVYVCQKRMTHIPNILKRFRQAVLTAACSGRLTADWRLDANDQQLKFQPPLHPRAIAEVEQLLETPEHWPWLPLQALCDPKRAICYGVIKLGLPHSNGIPCLRTSDVKSLYIDTADVKRIDPNISDQYQRTLLRGGEVLVNVRGTLGGVAVVPPELRGWNISREVALVPIDRVVPEFVSFWIASLPCQNWLTGVAKGVAYTGINIEDLRILPIALPSLAEQKEIVRRVEALFQFGDRIEARYTKAKTHVDKLTQSILAKAFRGELVPTEAELAAMERHDFETGEELLRRISSDALSNGFGGASGGHKPLRGMRSGPRRRGTGWRP